MIFKKPFPMTQLFNFLRKECQSAEIAEQIFNLLNSEQKHDLEEHVKNNGGTLLHWLCTTFEKNNLLKVHWDNFAFLLAEDALVQFNTKGSTPLFNLLASVEGRQFFIEKLPFFNGILKEKILSDDKAQTLLYELCKHPEGVKFISINWDFFKPLINKNLLLQQITKEGEESGKTILYQLLSTPYGQYLVQNYWHFFKKFFDKELLCQEISNHKATYLSLLYKNSDLSTTLLIKRWSFFKNLLDKELLSMPLPHSLYTEGPSLFYHLCNCPEGVQHIAQNWTFFEKIIDTELLSQAIRGEGEDEAKTPFYALCKSTFGIKFLLKHNDFFKDKISKELLTQKVNEEEASPLAKLFCTPAGIKFILKNWDWIKSSVDSDFLHLNEENESEVFESFCSCLESYDLLKSDTDFFKQIIPKNLIQDVLCTQTFTEIPDLYLLLSSFLTQEEAYEIFQEIEDSYRNILLKCSEPESLRQILSFYPLDKTDWEPLNPEFYAAFANFESLKILLAFYKNEEALQNALQRALSDVHLILPHAVKDLNSLKLLLALYSDDQARKAALEKCTNLFHSAVKNSESLKILLKFYSTEEVFQKIEKEDEERNCALHHATNEPESLKILLALYPDKNVHTAIEKPNTDGHTLLHAAAKNPESLKDLLAYYPDPSERFNAIKKQSAFGNVLHHAIDSKDALQILLEALSPQQRFQVLLIKNAHGQTLLQGLLKHPDLLAHFFPALKEVEPEKLSSLEDQIKYYEHIEELPIALLALNTLLTLEEKVVKVKAKSLEELYAGNAKLVQKSDARYQAVSEKYNSLFESFSLEKIEHDLKRDVLTFILEQAQKEKEPTQAIIHLLTPENIEALALGVDEALSERARVLFISNTDIYHMVWRAYDKQSLTGGWENLFVSPTEEKNVHHNDTSTISLNTASDEVRKRAALYYLAASDESTDVLSASKKLRLERLFACIAECRRAHNTEEAGDSENANADNPSCYLGTNTRLSESVLTHPDFQEDSLENLEASIYFKVKAKVESTFNTLLQRQDIDYQEKNKYYYALLMLGLENIPDLLSTEPQALKLTSLEGDEFTIKELTPYRAQFLQALDIEDLMYHISLQAEIQGILKEPSHFKLVEYYVLKAVLNLKGLNIHLSKEQQQILLGLDNPIQIDQSAKKIEERTAPLMDDFHDDFVYFPEPSPLQHIKSSLAYSWLKEPVEKESFLYEHYYQPYALHFLSIELNQHLSHWSKKDQFLFIKRFIESFTRENPKNIHELRKCFDQSAKEVVEKFQAHQPDLMVENTLLEQAIVSARKKWTSTLPFGEKRLSTEQDENLSPTVSALGGNTVL